DAGGTRVVLVGRGLDLAGIVRLAAAEPAVPPEAVERAHGLEEPAGFAGQAARQTGRATTADAMVLACGLVIAVRALRLLPVPPPVPAFAVAAALPSDTEDRPLTGDVTIAPELLPVLAQL
ncbi:hypothetical protein ACWGJM_47200, partial [Streptomyces sp. NPDC054834]